MRFALTAILAAFLAAPAFPEDLLRGIEFYKSRKYKEAAAELQKSIEAEPEDARARYYHGRVLTELEKYAEAEAELKQAEEISAKPAPEEGEAGRPVLSQDQIKVAFAALAMDRKDKDGESDRDKAKDYTLAEQLLEEAEKANGENPEVFLYRGKLAVHRKEFSAAIAPIERSIKLDPRQPYAHYYAGIAYSNLKRPDKMVEHFQNFLKLAPDAPEASKVKSLLRGIR